MAFNLFGVVMDKKLAEESLTKFHRLPQVIAHLDVSKSSIWSWVRQGKFPRPIKLSENITAWRASEVEEWAQSKIAASESGDQNEK
jgi:prophage regulatory protein